MDRRIMGLAERQRFARVGNNAARGRDDYSLGVAFDRDRMIRAGDFDRFRPDLDILFHSGHLWLSSCAGLRRRLAAVDEEHLTGRKGRLARSEEDDRVRNLVGLACTLERNTRHEAGLSFGAASKTVELRGLDRAGATALIR